MVEDVFEPDTFFYVHRGLNATAFVEEDKVLSKVAPSKLLSPDVEGIIRITPVPSPLEALNIPFMPTSYTDGIMNLAVEQALKTTGSTPSIPESNRRPWEASSEEESSLLMRPIARTCLPGLSVQDGLKAVSSDSVSGEAPDGSTRANGQSTLSASSSPSGSEPSSSSSEEEHITVRSMNLESQGLRAELSPSLSSSSDSSDNEDGISSAGSHSSKSRSESYPSLSALSEDMKRNSVVSQTSSTGFRALSMDLGSPAHVEKSASHDGIHAPQPIRTKASSEAMQARKRRSKNTH